MPNKQIMGAEPAGRGVIIGLIAWAVCATPLHAIAENATAPIVTITLLGTAGGPPPHVSRSQPASMLEVGGKIYLIDAGENVAQQLLRAGASAPRLSAVFLTHLHWDHTLGLNYLLATAWMMGRHDPLPIWGPPGTGELVSLTLRQVQLGEATLSVKPNTNLDLESLGHASEIKSDTPGVVFDDGNVRVSAVANSHFSWLPPPTHRYGMDKSYTYRFDTADGAVVFTGDTGPSEAVARLAKGAAVLVAEITDLASIRGALQQAGASDSAIDSLMQHMEHEHLTAAELGKLAAAAQVGKLVLTHYVIGRAFDPESFVSQIKPYFNGQIVVGSDLARINVSGSGH